MQNPSISQLVSNLSKKNWNVPWVCLLKQKIVRHCLSSKVVSELLVDTEILRLLEDIRGYCLLAIKENFNMFHNVSIYLKCPQMLIIGYWRRVQNKVPKDFIIVKLKTVYSAMLK